MRPCGARGRSWESAPLCFLAMLLAARVPVLPRYLIPGLGLAVTAAGFGWRKWTWAALAGFAAVSLTQYERPAANEAGTVIEVRTQPGTERPAPVPTDQEGGFIAEFAERDRRRPERYLLRPRKLLVETNWHSGKYRLRYATTGELEELFNRMPVRFVIVASEAKEPHEHLLAVTLRENPQRWPKIYAGIWEVYEDQARPTVPPAAVRAELERSWEQPQRDRPRRLRARSAAWTPRYCASSKMENPLRSAWAYSSGASWAARRRRSAWKDARRGAGHGVPHAEDVDAGDALPDVGMGALEIGQNQLAPPIPLVALE